MRNPWLSSFAAAENAHAKKRRISWNARRRRKIVNPESPHDRCKRTKESSAFSSKEFTNLHWDVQFIVRRGASTVVRACNRRGPSLKNFLKSSFVSDELARPKTQRTGLFTAGLIDPAATCSHRYILSRYIILPWVKPLFFFAVPSRRNARRSPSSSRQIARESCALSSLRNVRTSSRMTTTHHSRRYCQCHSISSLNAFLSARVKCIKRCLHHPSSRYLGPGKRSPLDFPDRIYDTEACGIVAEVNTRALFLFFFRQ